MVALEEHDLKTLASEEGLRKLTDYNGFGVEGINEKYGDST